MNLRRFTATLLVLALSPCSARAQGAPVSGTDRWHDIAARIEPATLVSVRLKDGSRTRGIILGVDSSSMTLVPKTRIPVSARDIRFDDIASIERTKQGMNPGMKVVIGAASLVGGLLLMMAVAFANYD